MMNKTTKLKHSLLGASIMLALPVSANYTPHGEHCGLLHDQLKNPKKATRFISSGCQMNKDCYAGAGTESDPYLLEVGVFVSAESMRTYDAREIEAIAVQGIADFNTSTENFSELGLPHVKAILRSFAVVPENIYQFGQEPMSNEATTYWNDQTAYNWRASHQTDIVSTFHHYPEQSGTYGLAGAGITINLDGHFPFLPNTFAHEMGHILGAGHQLGVSTSGARYEYSNAIACTLEDGSRLGSLVSSIEFSSIVLQFSDPSMPCGVHGETENARTVAEIAPTRAGYNEFRAITGTVDFTVSTHEINEGEAIEITFVRDGDTSQNAFVGLWADGLSTAQLQDGGYHYIEFAAGESVVNYTIQTIADGNWSQDYHALNFKLDYPVALDVSASSEKMVTVKEVDTIQVGEVSMAININTIAEGGEIEVTLTRTNGSDGDLSVNVSTELLSATTANVAPLNETVTFADGETVKTLTLSTKRDNVYSESVTLNLVLSGDNANNTSTLITIANTDAKNTNTANQKDSGGAVHWLSLLALLGLGFSRKQSKK